MQAQRIVWAGGEHDFALRIGELRALQQNCDAGPEEILNRLRLGRWRVDDVLEPIRLGLIGGGMERAEAGGLALKIADQRGFIALKLTAQSVLYTALIDPTATADEDDDAGKPEGADSGE